MCLTFAAELDHSAGPFETFEGVTSADWQTVSEFDDKMLSQCASFNVHKPGQVSVPIHSGSAREFFFTFFPCHLFRARLEAWKNHARVNKLTGLHHLDEAMILTWVAIAGVDRRTSSRSCQAEG
jgi:hypothetical protein